MTLKKGYYNFEIAPQHRNTISLMVNSIENGVLNDELNDLWDRNLNQINDIDHNVKGLLKSLCLTLFSLFVKPNENCRYMTLNVMSGINESYVDTSPLNSKIGDLVFLITKNGYQPMAINSEKQLIIDKTNSSRINVLLPKSSYMSSIISIFAIQQISIDQGKLDKLLTDAVYFKGVAGSGKSTNIANLDEKGLADISYIACT